MRNQLIAILLFLVLFFSSLNLSHELTAKQINWSSVTFSLGFITGAILAAFYLNRRATLRFLKRMKRALVKRIR